MKLGLPFIIMACAALVSFSSAGTITVILQQGLDGYSGCTDRELRNPEKNYGIGPRENVLAVSEY